MEWKGEERIGLGWMTWMDDLGGFVVRWEI